MKKPGLILVSVLFLALLASIAFAGGKRGAKDFDLAVTEDSKRDGRISVRIKAKRAFSVGRTRKQNRDYQTVPFESCLPTKKKGFPEVPYFKMAFQLRDNRRYTLVVQSLAFDEHSYDGEWLPSRGQILRNMDPAKVPYKMEKDALVDADYPGKEFVVPGEPFLIRDVRGMDVTIYPVLINTLQKRVKILRSIDFDLVPVAGIAANQQPLRPLKILSQNEPVLSSLFSNFRWNGELDDGLGHMLVIYTARDKDAIQPFIAHKKSLGFTVTEHNLDDTPSTSVKDIVQNAYKGDSQLLYVQLVGDWEDVQCEKIAAEDSEYCVNSDGCPQDNALGLVSGRDDYYDLIISRFSASSAADVTVQVDKVIDYETNPDSSWRTNGLGIASNQGTGDDKEYDNEHMNIIKINKLLPNGYSTVFEEYDWGASALGVTSAINGGVHVINYTGHGSTTSWGTTGFSIPNVDALENGSKLPFIFSVACSVGEYNGGTCFAETWLRKPDGGAVSALMATISQPWDPPMRGQDYMNDLLTGGYDYSTNPGIGTSTDRGKTRLGSIIFNAFNLQIAEAGSSDVETTKTWILFGDGSLMVKVPEGGDCPSCSGGEKVLEDITFKAGTTCTCTGTTSLTLGQGIVVESGASVTFEAPVVNVTPGFNFTPSEGSNITIRKN